MSGSRTDFPTRRICYAQRLRHTGWSEKDLEFLGFTPDEYRIRKMFPRRRDCARAIIDYMERENRWPRSRDFQWSNGLPSRRQMDQLFSQWVMHQSHVLPDWLSRGWGVIPNVHAQWYVAEKMKIKPNLAMLLPNQMIRRIAIERIGVGKFLSHNRAKLLDEHHEFGKLWSIDAPVEALTYLEVVNATAEPDGTFARYFLRVPPNVRKARQASAWTFGVTDWETFKITAAT